VKELCELQQPRISVEQIEKAESEISESSVQSQSAASEAVKE